MKYEYRMQSVQYGSSECHAENEDFLNILGEDSWKAVAIFPSPWLVSGSSELPWADVLLMKEVVEE